MRKINNLEGLKFNRLTVLHRDKSNPNKYGFWICQCDCGKIKSVYGSKLKSGDTKSCGCIYKPQAEDLTGKVFSNLVVIKRDESKTQYPFWICKCICGEIRSIDARSLRKGGSKSCGCLVNVTHRLSKTDIYNIWAGIKSRCFNKNNAKFKNYGGRGIKLYEPWVNDFKAFYDYVGNRPGKEYTIDRIDVNGDYCPDNIRWATHITQSNNTRTNVNITFKDETHTIAEWARIIGINYYVFYRSFKCDVEKALAYQESTTLIQF